MKNPKKLLRKTIWKSLFFVGKVIAEKRLRRCFVFIWSAKNAKKYFNQAQDLLIRGLLVCPNYSEEIYWLIASMAYEEKNMEELQSLSVLPAIY